MQVLFKSEHTQNVWNMMHKSWDELQQAETQFWLVLVLSSLRIEADVSEMWWVDIHEEVTEPWMKD